MGTITDAATLRSLYAPIRENPNARRAKMLTSMMDKSGYAAPMLAYVAGKEMAGAEAWDADREMKAEEAQAATTRQAGDAAAQQYAEKVMGHIIRVSEKDAVAATQMLKVESESGGNPYMARFKGITFNAPSKDGWATVAGPDGYVYHTYMPDLQAAVEAGPDSDLYKKTVIKIGEGKPTKQDPPKSREVQRGGMKVTEEWNEETKTWREIGKGPAWKPGEGEGKPPTPTTSQKELEQINGERAAAGQPPLSMEEYKADPIKQIVKEQLNKKKPAAPAKAPAPPKGAAMTGELSPDGKSITVGGTLYPIGADGTVIVNGKKYKVK
jgi:hypothetical protein